MTQFSPPNTQSASSTNGSDGERIAVLVGDRLCTQCGYNLVGQSIVREPHYNLLIVRCAECGTAASVQEYPLLGRWASRWAVLLAAFWFIILLLLLLIPPIPITALAYELADSSLNPIIQHLGQAQAEWAAANNKELPEQPRWRAPAGQEFHHYTTIMDGWLDEVDTRVILSQAGGFAGAVDWPNIRYWLLTAVPLFCYGAFWSLCLPHVRRRWLPLAALAVGGVLCSYWLVTLLAESGHHFYLNSVAMNLVGYRVMLLLIGFSVCVIAAGAWLGRPLTRLFIRALLPPRVRGALTMLWIVDELPLPRMGR